MTRPVIGLLFSTSGWFREVGLQSTGSQTSEQVADCARLIETDLGRVTDVVSSGVVFSPETAAASARQMAAARVDGVVVCPLTWCEDNIVRAALAELVEVPRLLWTFSPGGRPELPMDFQSMLRRSSTVATMQLSGMFKREGKSYSSVVGDLGSAEVYSQITDWCLAVRIRRYLRDAVVGVLPFRCDQMSTTYVDEFLLRKQYGITLRYLELESLRRRARAIDAVAISDFIHDIRSRNIEIEVDEQEVIQGARYSLGLEALLEEEGLHLLAMNDVADEMHKSLGMRPCLTNPRMSASGVVVAMEADIGAVVAMAILRIFTGESPFYTEPLSVDFSAGTLLLGHAGYHDSSNSDSHYPIRIVADVEYQGSDPSQGAVTYFKFRPGPITAVNSVWTDHGLQWCAWEGFSLPGPPVLEGNCHLLGKPDIAVEGLINRAITTGVSQHWVIVGGHHMRRLIPLCRVLGIECVPIDAPLREDPPLEATRTP